MSANADSAKAVLYIAGIIAVIYAVVYFFYKLDEISGKVDDLADRLTRPKTKPEDMDPIDVTSETVADSGSQSTMGTANPGNVNQSDQNDSKAINNQALAVRLDSQVKSDSPAQPSSGWRHTEDFHTVTVQGKSFNLTLYQSRALEKLWRARTNLIPELHQAAILEGIDSCSKRLRDVFKSNMAAYRALIARGERKGTFRLNFS